MYLYFKATGCYKYAHGCLETLAQIRCLLSERMSARLCFNRTVNFVGKQDFNYPKDLDIEHNNKLIKIEVHSFRGHITDRTLDRINKSILATDKVV